VSALKSVLLPQLGLPTSAKTAGARAEEGLLAVVIGARRNDEWRMTNDE
jgi:hypothetical protein